MDIVPGYGPHFQESYSLGCSATSQRLYNFHSLEYKLHEGKNLFLATINFLPCIELNTELNKYVMNG